MKLGRRLRQLRKEKGLTLRSLAEAAGVDFTYLSKIENEKVGYSPGADTIRALAVALGVDSLELLRLADKVPPEIQDLTATARARRFFERAREVASPDDWDALLDLLERRQRDRDDGKEGKT
jgi:transcriptional regulator with XRE-family HTH domain